MRDNSAREVNVYLSDELRSVSATILVK